MSTEHVEPAEIRSVAGPREGEIRTITPNGSYITTSREWAGFLLGQVAYAIEQGVWPKSLSMFDVARALRRAAGQAEYLQEERPGQDWHAVREAAIAEFTLGWYAADSEHGPLDKDEAFNPARDAARRPEVPTDPDTPSPVVRMRHLRTDRLLWLTEHGKWTDGTHDGFDGSLIDNDFYPVG